MAEMNDLNENIDSSQTFRAMDEQEAEEKNTNKKKKKEKKKFFDPENPVTEVLTTLGCLILVNIYFVICSLPVITIGASLTAMNRSCYDIMEMKDIRITKLFFKTFAGNFLYATIGWIIGCGILSAAGFGVYWAFSQGAGEVVCTIAIIVCAMVCIPTLMVMAYYFMIIGRYENDIFTHLINSFLMAYLKIGWTIIIIIMWGGVIAVYALISEALLYAGWIMAMIGFSLLCYATCHIYKRVITKTAREA